MTIFSPYNGVLRSIPRSLTTSTDKVIIKCNDREDLTDKSEVDSVMLVSFSAVCVSATATLDFFILAPGGAKVYLVYQKSIALGAEPYVFKDHCVPLQPGESFVAKASTANNIDISVVVVVPSPVQPQPFLPQVGNYRGTGGPAISPVSGYGGTGGPAGTGGGMIRQGR